MSNKLTYLMVLVLIVGINIISLAMANEEPVQLNLRPSEGASSCQIYKNFTRLQILPENDWLQIKPGEYKELKVVVRNLEEEAITTELYAGVSPFTECFIGSDWISATPKNIDIKPGEKQVYTLNISIPEDAEIGTYTVIVSFSNNTFSKPCLKTTSAYINAFDLLIEVWNPPKVDIQPLYIHDSVESGGTYEYKLRLENLEDEEISLNLKTGKGYLTGLEDAKYADIYQTGLESPKKIPNEWIKIEAPDKIKKGLSRTMIVTLDVPKDAKEGWYFGRIDLEIDDPLKEKCIQKLDIKFEVWRQPKKPFTENFMVRQGNNVTVVISTKQNRYDGFFESKDQKPSFDVTMFVSTLEGTVKLSPVPFKTVKKGEVIQGYQVSSTEYSEIYCINNATGGVWKLEILGNNVDRFEYTVSVESGK